MRLLEFWKPIRVVITRRVTEEEQVSVEQFHRTSDGAEYELKRFLSIFREHRKRTNEEVVQASRLQLTAIETGINAKGEQLRALDEEIEQRRAHLNDLNRHIAKRAAKVDPTRLNGPTDAGS